GGPLSRMGSLPGTAAFDSVPAPGPSHG
ncbi:signal peptidase I, partial [Streptomyces sp. DT225]